MTDLMRPEDLKKLSDDADMAKAQEHIKRAKKEEEEQKGLREAFMERGLHPEVRERVNAAVRRAAEQGNRELRVITFPANYCSDGGRRINNNEPDWPSSLEGFAKKAYEFYEKELKHLGFKVSAEVISFEGGMPGTIAMYLKW